MKIKNKQRTDTTLLLALRHSGQVVVFPGGVHAMHGPVIVCDDPNDDAMYELTGHRCFDPGFTAQMRLVVNLTSGSAAWLPGTFQTELLKAEVHIDENRQS